MTLHSSKLAGLVYQSSLTQGSLISYTYTFEITYTKPCVFSLTSIVMVLSNKKNLSESPPYLLVWLVILESSPEETQRQIISHHSCALHGKGENLVIANHWDLNPSACDVSSFDYQQVYSAAVDKAQKDPANGIICYINTPSFMSKHHENNILKGLDSSRYVTNLRKYDIF